ncbi:MAG: dynamin family protein [Oscillospiraceae bacterium]|nr:dynamin family protein [Oscillospiraceae bacterium]
MQNSDLKQRLELLKSYSVIYDGANVKDTIDTIENRIDQNEFKIAVVGEFSAGKSTFINAIVGKDLLKHATLETTAALTYIHNVKPDDSRVNTCTIRFADGTVQSFEHLTDLEKYTTTQSDIDVVTEVKSVDIYINFIDVQEDLVIVDTPGLNGLADKHRELTVEEIKQAHSCIYLFPKRGLAQTDVEFIKYISNYQNTFIFIYNFIDELNISEGENPEDKVALIRENVSRFVLENTSRKILTHYCAMSALKALAGKDKDIKRLYEDDFSDIDEEYRKQILEESNFSAFEMILKSIINDVNFQKNRYISNCYTVMNLMEYILMLSKKKQAEIENKILKDRAFRDISQIKQQKIVMNQNQDKVLEQLYELIRQLFEENEKILGNDIDENLRLINDNITNLINGESDYPAFERKVEDNVYKQSLQKMIDQYQLEFDYKKENCFQLVYKTILARIDEYGDIISVIDRSNAELKISAAIDKELAADNIKNDIKNLEQIAVNNKKFLEDFNKQREGFKAEIEKIFAEIDANKNRKEELIAVQRRKEAALGDRPVENVSYIVEEFEEDRRGIARLFQFIIGKKKSTRQVPQYDDTKGLEWDKKKREIKDSTDEEREAINRELSNLEAKKCAIEEKIELHDKENASYVRKMEVLNHEIAAKKDELAMFEERLETEYLSLRKKQLKQDIEKYLFEGESSITALFKESLVNDVAANSELVSGYIKKEFEKRLAEKNSVLDEIINGNLIDIQNRYKNKKTEIAKIEEMYNELKVELENEQTSLTV